MMFMNTKKFTLTAMFAALACVATLVIHIPSPTNGYMNLGDAVVLLGAFFLGPWCGAIAGGVGSALSDLILGYTAYVPATLIIKGLMGLCAGLIAAKSKKFSFTLLASIVAEIIMVGGYYLYEVILAKNFATPLTGIPSNLCQALIGLVAGCLLYTVLSKNKYISTFLQ